MSEDITNYEGVIAEVASDWVSHMIGSPMVAANYVLIVDARGTNRKNAVAAFSPAGTPAWMRQALVERSHEVIGEGYQFIAEDWDEDDDVDTDD